MIAIFLGYLLAISIGVGVEQVHKAKKECEQKHKVIMSDDGGWMVELPNDKNDN